MKNNSQNMNQSASQLGLNSVSQTGLDSTVPTISLHPNSNSNSNSNSNPSNFNHTNPQPASSRTNLPSNSSAASQLTSNHGNPSSKIQSFLKIFLKSFFVVGLLYFLVKKGFISVQATSQALQEWHVILPAIGALFVTSALGVIRWQWLLQAQNVHLPWSKTFQLTYIGTFFNIALPGAVSGDFVKAFYVGQILKGQKSKVFGTILLDRVAGLSALVLVSAGALGLWLSGLHQHAPHSSDSSHDDGRGWFGRRFLRLSLSRPRASRSSAETLALRGKKIQWQSRLASSLYYFYLRRHPALPQSSDGSHSGFGHLDVNPSHHWVVLLKFCHCSARSPSLTFGCLYRSSARTLDNCDSDCTGRRRDGELCVPTSF